MAVQVDCTPHWEDDPSECADFIAWEERSGRYGDYAGYTAECARMFEERRARMALAAAEASDAELDRMEGELPWLPLAKAIVNRHVVPARRAA